MTDYQQLKKALERKNYLFFDDRDYNLNLVGVRSDDNRSGQFNDRLMVAFKQHGAELCFSFAFTTDPGVYWRENPMHVDGTAVVVPGQYRGLWRIGSHQGLYEALTQTKRVTVARDNNRDSVAEIDGEHQTGIFGINLHRAHQRKKIKEVEKWSAGCQVVADPDEYAILMGVCRKAAKLWGNSFTYTLIEEGDLWPEK